MYIYKSKDQHLSSLSFMLKMMVSISIICVSQNQRLRLLPVTLWFYLQGGGGSRGDSALNSASVTSGITEGKNLT